MIEFACPATQLLNGVMDYALQCVEDDVSIIEEEDEYFFDKPTTEIMGGNGAIIEAVKDITKAHKSKEYFRLSEYHWLVLEAVVRNFCDEYNNSGKPDAFELDTFKLENGCTVATLNSNILVDTYFTTVMEFVEDDDPPIEEVIEDKEIIKLDDEIPEIASYYQNAEWAFPACEECDDLECEYRS